MISFLEGTGYKHWLHIAWRVMASQISLGSVDEADRYVVGTEIKCRVVNIAAQSWTAAVRSKPDLTMRHDRRRACGFGGAFLILIFGLGVTTAQRVSLNHSAVEDIGWDLKSGDFSVAVRVYGLLLSRLLILCLAHRCDTAYVTFVRSRRRAYTPCSPAST
jgi:hypothetical protein